MILLLAVKGPAISAVAKALDICTIAIRKTIDAGLKKVKEAMKISPNDTLISFDKQPLKLKTSTINTENIKSFKGNAFLNLM
ncbi:Variable outer membrane protein (plasmid) [Borrelia hermsii YBT]|uniref:Variable large protein n=1 Tax=Borrelia hermsii YBT TaxID=1313295 RepID=W5T0N9_BORHE|nr:Variable outer membrane protein [Borrelia hermsii YBT]